MKTLLVFSILLTPTAFAGTDCSDPTAEIQYSYSAGGHGAPPMDGELTGTISVSFRGVTQSESKSYKGKDAELGPINPDFSQKKILSENQDRKIFSAKLVLSKNPDYKGNAEPQIPLPYTSYVVCRELKISPP
jgi:hypothetical protein